MLIQSVDLRAGGKLLAISFVSLAILGAASTSIAVPITVPTGLSPGDEYRLVFVTSTTRNATSSNIADYNLFVTGVANTIPELLALGTTWSATGSTRTVGSDRA
jgi:hypothetical protein